MKVAVMGAGAIGCVAGALLSDHGHDVTLIGRAADQAAAIQQSGLIIDGYSGVKKYDIPVATALEFCPEVIVLAVKTHDIISVCTQSSGRICGCPVVITMQNGVRSDELAAELIGRERLVSSVVMFGATYLSPGHVTYNFPGGLVIGKAFPEGADDALTTARNLLSGPFDLHVSHDIQAVHWTKLILNLNNALACSLGKTLQETFLDPRMCRLGVMMMKEASDVLSTANIRLANLPDLPLDRLMGLLNAPIDIAAGIYGDIMKGLSLSPLPGSVLQSIRRGKTTEVDYLNGEIAVMGLMHRHPAPLNMKITTLIKNIEKTGEFYSSDSLLKEMDA